MNTFCNAAAYLGLRPCSSENYGPNDIVERNFIEHLSKFNVWFSTREEFQFRLGIFRRKDAELRQINSDRANTFTVGHNQFSTWTDDELMKLLRYNGP